MILGLVRIKPYETQSFLHETSFNKQYIYIYVWSHYHLIIQIFAHGDGRASETVSAKEILGRDWSLMCQNISNLPQSRQLPGWKVNFQHSAACVHSLSHGTDDCMESEQNNYALDSSKFNKNTTIYRVISTRHGLNDKIDVAKGGSYTILLGIPIFDASLERPKRNTDSGPLPQWSHTKAAQQQCFWLIYSL